MAGLADADDDTLSVYADDREAVLLTHDRAFTERRREHPIGRHVRLACRERKAADIVRDSLPELQAILESRRDVTVVLSRGRPPRVLGPPWH